MAKATKNASASGSKPITDYFSRKPATRSKSDNISDGQSNTPKKRQLKPTTSSPPTDPSTSALSPENRLQMRSSTPESNSRVESGCVPPQSQPIAIPPTPFSPKKISTKKNRSRTKNFISSSESSSIDEVPGSVSGEEEMECVPRVRRDVEASKQSVAKWRNESPLLSDLPERMNVDEVPTSNFDTDQSPSSAERSTPPPSQQQLTPPPTTVLDHQALPPIPTAIETARKTEELIAAIKAKAIAAAKSSPIEQEIRPFKETLSDSDTDEELRPLEINVKGKGKAKEVAPSVPAVNTYYNTRSTNAHSKSKMISPTVLQSERRQAATKKKHNPFTALLKEKREDDRSGRSDLEFIKAAENMLPKSQMLLEMDEEDGYDSFETPSQKTAAWLGREVDDMKVDLDDGNRRRLFGEQSEGIKDILDGEQKNLQADERRKIEIGVRFWRDNTSSAGDDVDMDVEPTLDFGEHTKSPVLRKLYNALKSRDQVRAIAILDSGLLTTVNPECLRGVTSYLTYLALSPANDRLSSAAFEALRNVWITSRGSELGIILQDILNAVSRWGAYSQLLNLAGSKPSNIDAHSRASLIFRLVKLTESSARSRLLNINEIPELVLILLAISLDPSTSASLQIAIAVVLDAIFQSIADPNVVADIEPIICTKILTYIKEFDPFNISRIVTLLTGSEGRSTRIARWVARSVLLGKTQVTESEYCHAPAVQDLSDILVQGATPVCQAFQINHDTDYVELGHYVQILAVALTDIPSYLPSEIAAVAAIKAQHPIQASPSKDKIDTPLEHLNRCITFVQRKITDNGTDIERSRTKAALHHLSMRLYFQLAARKADKNPAISNYFERRNPTARR
ncbi:hypothetical protein C8J55DRAFT_608843 [Lentinula edodes]|uniref:Uncharacterized protein n=1 Tax=Lentinula lateritia TaxID=40482 RepID=A0A9W8ZXI7_9AGAR|nr:hypothetical protein C8J55DRAFT_608843 [Lentinula edodes]